MNSCEKCQKSPRHPDKKCCFNCARSDSNCEVWHNCGDDCPGWEPKKLTIADRIRAMFATDEGIAKILLALDISLAEDGREFTLLYCDGKNNCITEDDGIICTDEMRTACILRWLQQPAKEG